MAKFQSFLHPSRSSSAERRSLLSGGVALLGLVAVGCSRSESATLAFEPEPAVSVFVLMSTPVGASANSLVEGHDLARRLGEAKAAGSVADLTLIAVAPGDAGLRPAFSTFGVLEFRHQAAFKAWKSGGAAPRVAGMTFKEVDVLIDERPRVQSPAAVYVVDQYEAMLPQEDYYQYVRLYIAPNMAAQKAGGVLAGYAVYWEREPTGGRHRVVLVKEYFNADAFSRVDAVRAGNEPTLLKNADWKRIHEVKSRYRTDLSSTKAIPIT